MSERLREEFNRWALQGRGAHLEAHHRGFVEQILPEMNLQPTDRVLEVGCGEGWACRMLAERATEGLVVGLDVSDEMVRRARAKSVPYENLLFVWSSAEQIPWQENFFTQALAVESFYYFEDSEKALREICRVLISGGRLWVLNHLSKENALTLRWLQDVKVPVQLRSAEQYSEMFPAAGSKSLRTAWFLTARLSPGTPPGGLPIRRNCESSGNSVRCC